MGSKRLWLAWGTAGVVGMFAACSAGDTTDEIVGQGDGDETSTTDGDDDLDFGDGDEYDECNVPASGNDAPPPCADEAPPNSFDPEVQWEYTAPSGATMMHGSITTPLVGNFTDDNGDAKIDLCDTPDIVVNAFMNDAGALRLLSGDTGEEHFVFAEPVDVNITPAFADIDGDELPEVVAVDPDGKLIAFEHDGSLKWRGDSGVWAIETSAYCTTLSIYDLEGDGTAEILGAFDVYDHNGHKIWGMGPPGGPYYCPTPSAADIDGDGELEVLFGHAAYNADGSLLWKIDSDPGHAHVADFDGDTLPEIFFTSWDGLRLIEHDGTVTFGPVMPTSQYYGAHCWGKPAVVHDLNGDGVPEVGAGSCYDYTAYRIGASPQLLWSAPISDSSGLATATAFDFLGDGIADAIYSDEDAAYVFDGATGNSELQIERFSGTLVEFPVVADVDNDGSAEIVVVANWGWPGNPNDTGPTVMVIRDREDRWIQARRIWNQHAYHITNIREDGRLPTTVRNNWELFNTFRANSQIEEVDCVPELPK